MIIVNPFNPAQRAASTNSAVLSGSNELLIILRYIGILTIAIANIMFLLPPPIAANKARAKRSTGND